MNICLWSGSSFEKWYSSYHLMEDLVLEVLKAGHELWLVQAQRGDGRLPSSFSEYNNLHVINIPQREPEKSNFIRRYTSSIDYYRKAKNKISELNSIDVIFLQSNNVAFFPVRYAKAHHIPVVYNVQDVFPIDAMLVGKISKRNPFYLISRWMQAWAYKKSDRVITISEDLAKTIRNEEDGYRARHGLPDVDVIYNWSYQDKAYEILDNNNHFLSTYKIKRSDGFRVVYAGNVGQMIDIDTFVKTAVILKKQNDIKFYIIGEGSNLQQLKEMAEKEHLTNLLFFPRQPMEYAPDNYCMADINIIPIPNGVIYTCMPSKINTCLLSEKPTVVSMNLDSDMAKRLGTIDQWTVVTPGDSKNMADEILKVYKNGSKKSNNATNFLQKLGSIENSCEYVKILESVSKENA